MKKWLKEPDANDSKKSMSEYNKAESEEPEEDEIATSSGAKATVKVRKASRVLTSELATLAPSQMGDGPPLLRVVGSEKVPTMGVKQRMALRKTSPRDFLSRPATPSKSAPACCR